MTPPLERMPLGAQDVVAAETVRQVAGLATAAFWNPRSHLLNRAALDLFERQHDRGATGRLAVAYADLADFKAVNDTPGHDAGDAAILFAARKVSEWATRLGGDAFHVGGDEFVLVFPEDSLGQFQGAMRQGHVVQVMYQTHEFPVVLNAGVALPEPTPVFKDLRDRAELACRVAKARASKEAVVWRSDETPLLMVDRRWRCATCNASVSVLAVVGEALPSPLACPICRTETPAPGQVSTTPGTS